MNDPVQGSSADVIKILMVRIDEVFREKNIRSKMVLQVHDELVFDVYKEELDLVKNLVRSKMETAVETKIPLVANVCVGLNWLEAH